MNKLKSFISISLFTVSLLHSVLLSAATARPGQEEKVFKLINQNRVANGHRNLKWSSAAAKLARQHSVNMANGKVPVGHSGIERRWKDLRKAVPRAISFGENVAFNQGYSNPARRAVIDWLNSPRHYANIMGNFSHTGVGVASNSRGGYYFTQIFYKTAPRNALLIPCSDKQAKKDEENLIINCTYQTAVESVADDSTNESLVL
jgi:uncharacterized protein YkwD